MRRKNKNSNFRHAHPFLYLHIYAQYWNGIRLKSLLWTPSDYATSSWCFPARLLSLVIGFIPNPSARRRPISHQAAVGPNRTRSSKCMMSHNCTSSGMWQSWIHLPWTRGCQVRHEIRFKLVCFFPAWCGNWVTSTMKESSCVSRGDGPDESRESSG